MLVEVGFLEVITAFGTALESQLGQLVFLQVFRTLVPPVTSHAPPFTAMLFFEMFVQCFGCRRNAPEVSARTNDTHVSLAVAFDHWTAKRELWRRYWLFVFGFNRDGPCCFGYPT